MENLLIGVELIAKERQKQIDKHGFTAEHHVDHPEWYEKNQMVDAVKGLLSESIYRVPLNWDQKWYTNLTQRDYKERLIIAGALIAAELDRLDAIEKLK